MGKQSKSNVSRAVVQQRRQQRSLVVLIAAATVALVVIGVSLGVLVAKLGTPTEPVVASTLPQTVVAAPPLDEQSLPAANDNDRQQPPVAATAPNSSKSSSTVTLQAKPGPGDRLASTHGEDTPDQPASSTGDASATQNLPVAETLTTMTEVTEATDSVPAPSTLAPNQMDAFERLIGESVVVEGIPVSANASGSGKTRYLRFSQQWDETIMVYMLTRDVGDALSLEILEHFIGRKIRVDGVIERQFGTNRLGVRIKAPDQIIVVE